jgi:hypothetical protein
VTGAVGVDLGALGEVSLVPFDGGIFGFVDPVGVGADGAWVCS